MLKVVLSFLLLAVSANAFAINTPSNSENLLWQFSPSYGEPTREYCVTTKEPPFAPNLCVGEKRRASMKTPVEGYMLFQANASDARKETLRIVKVSPWKYITSDTDFVANADVYQRDLTLVDSNNRSSVITEVFGYMPNYPEDARLRPRLIKGTLPNGLRIVLTNFYFFYK